MTDSATGYAVALADSSYEWYRSHAIRTRRSYKVIEVLILVVSSAVPVSALVWPGNSTGPALLGVLVVVLSGLRSIFNWQDNYLRYSGAREAVEAERRRYHTGAEPYDDAATRDRLLVAAVSRIEQEEMAGWVKIASERPKP